MATGDKFDIIEIEMPSMKAVPIKSKTQIDSKVGAGAFAGALAILTVWILGECGLEVPNEPAVAIGTVYAFVMGYFAKS